MTFSEHSDITGGQTPGATSGVTPSTTPDTTPAAESRDASRSASVSSVSSASSKTSGTSAAPRRPGAAPGRATAASVESLDKNNQMERGLTNRHVQFIAIGGTIGTGLFLGSGKSIALTGPSIILVLSLIHI